LAKQNLVERIESMANESLFLLKEICILIEAYVQQYGVTEEYINEQANLILAEWHQNK
jgi:hypothetical protein